MMDATLRIKNLSIALEAISKLNYKSYGDRVWILLGQAITEAEKETQWPRQGPARTSTTNTDYTKDPYENF